MPLREYKCEQCQTTFEWLEMRKADAPAACPVCDFNGIYMVMSASCFKVLDGYESGVRPKFEAHYPDGTVVGLGHKAKLGK